MDEPQKEAKTTRATIDKIVWSQGTRIIARARAIDRGSMISVIGDMQSPQVGQLYEFSGKWSKNEKYNSWDFRFTSYKTILPDDNSGIHHYLVRIAKWVGPATATALIQEFGDQTLAMFKRSPEQVFARNIRGLTLSRCQEISDALSKNEKLELAMVETGQMIGDALGMYAVEKAVKKWGSNAAKIIKRNAFRLLEIHGVGFKRADDVFQLLGGRTDARRRSAHAVEHILEEEASRSGHTIVAESNVIAQAMGLLGGNLHPQTMDMLIRSRRVIRWGGQFVSLESIHRAERLVANVISEMLSCAATKPLQITDAMKPLVETMEEGQLAALRGAMQSRVMILRGAPGTGKTYTLARILTLFIENGLHPELAAPTGKAAKQMQIALSGVGAGTPRTIHSLLEPDVDEETGEFRFGRNQKNPLDCNALIVDETSMVDVRLAASLLSALRPDTRLILVGDNYQLPSVGPGAVLRDLIAAGVPDIELRKIKRNAGLIVHSCHAIKDGREPAPASKLDLPAGQNWRHVDTESDRDTIEVIKKLLRDTLPARGIDPVWQAQIISPTNTRGALSCATINDHAKGIVNPGETIGNLTFSVGDKVVRLKNGKAPAAKGGRCDTCEGSGKIGTSDCLDCGATGIRKEDGSDVRIVNGDIGVVKNADEKSIYVDFFFPDRSVKLSRRNHNLALAYCLTCHKMQGSQAPVVVLPVSTGMTMIPMVTREWIYTAFSRPQQFLVTIGNLDTLPRALARVGNKVRCTALSEIMRSIGIVRRTSA